VLDDDAVTDAARRLLAAERSRQPIRQLSLQYPQMTVEDAYRVQRSAGSSARESRSNWRSSWTGRCAARG